MSDERTKLQSYGGLPQTEDEFAPNEDGLSQTEDEIDQTEDEDLLTEDSITEAEAEGKRDKVKGKKRSESRNKKAIKEAQEIQKPDKRQILRILYNLVPYLVTLFLLCVLAFSILAAVRSDVEAYGEKVYRENEEYLSYE